MASITKVQNNIVVQCDNSSTPSVHSEWENATVSYSDTDTYPYVQLTINNTGYRFGDNGASPMGELTEINDQDVSAFTNAEKATLIRQSVLTPDKFSGTAIVIDDTTMVAGQFTAIQIDADAVFNVTAVTGTIMLDGNGDPVDISGWSALAFAHGVIKYGNFSQIQLVSGKVTAYSNL